VLRQHLTEDQLIIAARVGEASAEALDKQHRAIEEYIAVQTPLDIVTEHSETSPFELNQLAEPLLSFPRHPFLYVHPPTLATHCQVPVELSQKIVDELVDAPASLRTASLLSREFLLCSRQLLFSNIKVDCPYRLHTLVDLLKSETAQFPTSLTRSRYDYGMHPTRNLKAVVQVEG
jgi:hypothetical protein